MSYLGIARSKHLFTAARMRVCSNPQLLTAGLHIASLFNVFISPEPDLDSLQLKGDYGDELAGEVR